MLLRCTSLEALRVKTLARTGMTTGSAAFTTTHGVIDRVHYYTAVAVVIPVLARVFTLRASRLVHRRSILRSTLSKEERSNLI